MKSKPIISWMLAFFSGFLISWGWSFSQDRPLVEGVSSEDVLAGLENLAIQDQTAALHCVGILGSLNRGEEELAKDQARLVLAEFYSAKPRNPTGTQAKIRASIEELAAEDEELRRAIGR